MKLLKTRRIIWILGIVAVGLVIMWTGYNMVLANYAEKTAMGEFNPRRIALGVQTVGRGLDLPVYVTNAGDASGRIFVVEKKGTIRLLGNGEVFLDIRDRIRAGGDHRDTAEAERGMLSVVFHPKFEENGFFYVNYTDLNGDTTISRFNLTTDRNRGDPASEEVLLKVKQPHAYHNGGMLAFGPDGYLYIGLGDGGGAGDQFHNAQNLQTLLGKILRIDVDRGVPYAIPADNPFVDDKTARPEIWSYGWRNPWRFSFDRATGDIYMAEVGEYDYESIDFQPADSNGGENYGWPILEGSHCFADEYCERSGLVEPVAEYQSHVGDDPECAVIGGYVYRGKRYPMLQGVYLFSDYCSGKVWALKKQEGVWTKTEMLDIYALVSSFGEDEAGEIYIVDIHGKIYHLTARYKIF